MKGIVGLPSLQYCQAKIDTITTNVNFSFNGRRLVTSLILVITPLLLLTLLIFNLNCNIFTEASVNNTTASNSNSSNSYLASGLKTSPNQTPWSWFKNYNNISNNNSIIGSNNSNIYSSGINRNSSDNTLKPTATTSTQPAHIIASTNGGSGGASRNGSGSTISEDILVVSRHEDIKTSQKSFNNLSITSQQQHQLQQINNPPSIDSKSNKVVLSNSSVTTVEPVLGKIIDSGEHLTTEATIIDSTVTNDHINIDKSPATKSLSSNRIDPDIKVKNPAMAINETTSIPTTTTQIPTTDTTATNISSENNINNNNNNNISVTSSDNSTKREIFSEGPCQTTAPNKNSLPANESSKYFDIDYASNVFQDSMADKNAISLDHYIEGFKELMKFFHSLGSIFLFVTSDLENKIGLIENYRNVEKGGCNSAYLSIQSAVEYETKENLLRDTKRQSGARTILRLHRALEFLSMLMMNLSKLEQEEETAPAARDAYSNSLAKHHPWTIRTIASFAMRTLPQKKMLVESVLGKEHSGNETEVNEKMLILANVTENLFNVVDKYYEENNIKDLP